MKLVLVSAFVFFCVSFSSVVSAQDAPPDPPSNVGPGETIGIACSDPEPRPEKKEAIGKLRSKVMEQFRKEKPRTTIFGAESFRVIGGRVKHCVYYKTKNTTLVKHMWRITKEELDSRLQSSPRW